MPLELWNQFVAPAAAAHPIVSHAAAAGLALLIGPKLLGWAETSGLDKVNAWVDARQEAALRRAGFSPAQIIAVREHEVADLRRSADDLEKRNQAAKAALLAAAPAPAAIPDHATQPLEPGR